MPSDEVIDRYFNFSNVARSKYVHWVEKALEDSKTFYEALPALKALLGAEDYNLRREQFEDAARRLDAGLPTEITSDYRTIELRINAIRSELGLGELPDGSGARDALPESSGVGEVRHVAQDRTLAHDGEQETA